MEILWDFILRSFFVLAVLFLQFPLVGLLLYGSLALAGIVEAAFFRKHWKSNRRILALISAGLSAVAWIALGIGLRVLFVTIIFIAKQ